MKWTYRRGTGKARNSPNDPNDAQRLFQHNQWKLKVRMYQLKHNIPPQMIVSLDETFTQAVPSSKFSLAERGSRDVLITGIDDKRGVTVSHATHAGYGMIGSQVIYGGKTTQCHANSRLAPDDWCLTHTMNHWQDEVSLMAWYDHTIIPYFSNTRDELQLPEDAKGLVIYDVHWSHKHEDSRRVLAANDIRDWFVPAGETDILQVCDVGINKPFKNNLKANFRVYYGEQVQKQIQQGIAPKDVRIDLKWGTIKNPHLRWTVKAVNDLSDETIENAWRAVFGTGFRTRNQRNVRGDGGGDVNDNE